MNKTIEMIKNRILEIESLLSEHGQDQAEQTPETKALIQEKIEHVTTLKAIRFITENDIDIKGSVTELPVILGYSYYRLMIDCESDDPKDWVLPSDPDIRALEICGLDKVLFVQK